MGLKLDKNDGKETVLKALEAFIQSTGLVVSDKDYDKPWGAWIQIADESTEPFLKKYFPEVDEDELYKYGKRLRPKYLLVAPGAKLSWQYHERRAELWKCVVGPVGIMVSDTDVQPDFQDILQVGDLSQIGHGVRHRLTGLDNWGLVAEIWQHTDPNSPSEEDDIVRLKDDYGRN